MFIPKVACGCGRAMKCEKNGVVVEAHSSFGPYYKVEADRYECPACGTQVITGFASQVLAEHFQPSFKTIKADVIVKLEG